MLRLNDPTLSLFMLAPYQNISIVFVKPKHRTPALCLKFCTQEPILKPNNPRSRNGRACDTSAHIYINVVHILPQNNITGVIGMDCVEEIGAAIVRKSGRVKAGALIEQCRPGAWCTLNCRSGSCFWGESIRMAIKQCLALVYSEIPVRVI